MSDPTLSVEVTLAADAAHGFALDVAFDVPPGVTVLFGPSGSGKSRTLACIAGLVRPTKGRVALGTEVWFDAARAEQLPIHERRIAYVFQSLALFPHLTAAANVAYGLPSGLARAERRARAVEMLAKMHVAELADRMPRTFSGGEAQRVALARAFAIEPRVVLLDEPFSALDAAVKTALLREVADALAKEHVPTILVTHQKEDARILGDRVVFLDRGRVTRTAAVADASFE